MTEENSNEELKVIKKIGNKISIKKEGISMGTVLVLFYILILSAFNVYGFLLIFLINFFAGAQGGYNSPQSWQKWVKWLFFPSALVMIPLVLLSIYLIPMGSAKGIRSVHDIIIVISWDFLIMLLFFLPILVGAYIGSKMIHSE